RRASYDTCFVRLWREDVAAKQLHNARQSAPHSVRRVDTVLVDPTIAVSVDGQLFGKLDEGVPIPTAIVRVHRWIWEAGIIKKIRIVPKCRRSHHQRQAVEPALITVVLERVRVEHRDVKAASFNQGVKSQSHSPKRHVHETVPRPV